MKKNLVQTLLSCILLLEFTTIFAQKTPFYFQNEQNEPVQYAKPTQGPGTEPGYYKQWFEKHKTLEGTIPDGLTERWYKHDQAHFLNQRPEGNSPVANAELLAPNTRMGGRTRAVLIDRVDSNKIWAGSVSGGLWRTTDGGNNWRVINDQASTLSVTCLTQNPLNPNIIYYGTGEVRGASQAISGGGVFKSTDGGVTFNQLPASATLTAMRLCNYIAHSPKDTNTLYVGTSSGTFISTDGGTTFTSVLSGANTGIVFHPNGTVLLATQNSGVFRATDGRNFSKINNAEFPATGGSTIARILIENCKAFPNVTYALFCGAEYDKEGNRGLFKSSDFGLTWTKMSDSASVGGRMGTTYQAYCQMLMVHPTDTNRIIIGGLSAIRSTNGGVSFSSFSSGHADNHTAVNIGNGDTYLCGNDGGVYKCSWTNAFSTTNLNNGYATFQYYAGNFSRSGKLAIGGTQDNGTWRYVTNAASSQFGGDGGYCHFSLQDTMIAYYSTQQGPTYRNMNVYGGGGTNVITPTAAVAEGVDFINQFEINYAEGSQLYYRSNTGLWRSINRGTTWQRMHTSTIARIQAIGVTWETDPSVFIGGANHFWRFDTTASGTPPMTPVNLFSSVPTAIAAFAWGTITCRNNDPNTIYVGLTTVSPQGRAWRIRNAKSNTPVWQNISGNLEQTLPVYQIQAHPDQPDKILFAATAFGLYYTLDGGTTWTKETRIPNVVIMEMKLRPNDFTLFCFTHGRGLWLLPLNRYTPTSTPSVVEKLEVDISPNPTSNLLIVNTKTPLSKSQIFDLNGREILTESQNPTQLNVSDLPNGAYLLRVFDEKGLFTTRKFVKN
jgi:Secretion system C-terminal sorting domain